MSFAFIPRTVSKTHKHTQHIQREQPEGNRFNFESNVSSKSTLENEQKLEPRPSKSKYSDDDYVHLLCLALSDYALWAEPDLRRKIEWNAQEADGFIPLSYLLNHSTSLAPLKLGASQTAIAKALRSSAGDIFEIRLLVSDPSTSAWFGGREDSKDIGAYEIRRKDWQEALTCPFSKADWEQRTIYVENLPIQHRSLPAISQFISTLLSPDSTHRTRVQNITFPPHHQDKLGDHPTCKGFALVALASYEDATYLLSQWPWERNVKPARHDSSVQDESAVIHDGIKFGFRTLSRIQWVQLKEEYLAYRKRLVEEMVAYEDAESLIPVASSSDSNVVLQPRPDPLIPPRDIRVGGDIPMIDSSSPYPPNSLVFVRNVHPETNKTTLRKLFATAFKKLLENGELQTDGLDYVDFNKGTDSCHIRLSTPRHAQVLVDHFTLHPVLHSQGLDEVGTATDTKAGSIAMEVVLGKREEIYWEKVPEKVRREAVQKAIALVKTPFTVNVDNSKFGNVDENEDTRKRKRRKH